MCLEAIFRREPTEPKCPDDGEPLQRSEIFRDKCAQKEILALECYCPKKSLGCTWTGQLAKLREHEGECPSCGNDHRLNPVEHSMTLHEIQRADQVLLDFQDERLALLAEEVMRLNERPRPRSAAREYDRLSMPGASGNDHRLDRVEHSMTLHEIQLADQDLKLQILETTSHDGTFLWKIDEFQRRFREAAEGKTISIYSPPFHTSRYGYKLCARVYLNGDGPLGKGKYVSLFTVVMRGEYDALLSWPFQQKITMKLLDQDQISHVTETFRPDPNSLSFQRPCSEMNIASGCPTFCSHSLLRSRGYVRDDTIFIKIIVDTTEVPVPEVR